MPPDNIIGYLVRISSILSRAAAGLAGIVIAYMVAHTLLEILLRAVFASSTFVLDEFIGYAVAAATFLSLGYALDRGYLLRVQILSASVSLRIRRTLDLACVGATLAVTLFFGWYLWQLTSRNIVRGAVSNSIAEVPLWIPQAFMLVGLAVFALQLLALGARLLLSASEDAAAPPLTQH